MKTNISIIIPSWNTSKTTSECLESIYKNLKSLSYEIIVVDNASTDDSVSSIKAKFPKTLIIQNSLNLGFSKASNIGAKLAKGEYLLFLNSDMLFPDDSIISMYQYLKDNKNIGTIGPRFLNPDFTPQASVFPPQSPINAIKEFWFSRKDSYSKYLPNPNSPQSVWAISGGCLLISKTLFNQIGGWNEKYNFYFEDLDLCRTIRQLHRSIFYYPLTTVIHHHGQSGKNIANQANQWRRLIPSAKIYHGLPKYYLLFFITYVSQKISKVLGYLPFIK